MDGAREPERAKSLPAGLEAREADLSPMLPLLLELEAAEEVRIGSVQVSQRLLGSTLGDIIQPGMVGLLEDVEFSVEVDGARSVPRELVRLYLSCEAPVEGETRGATVVGKCLALGRIGLELGLVGPPNLQASSPPLPLFLPGCELLSCRRSSRTLRSRGR